MTRTVLLCVSALVVLSSAVAAQQAERSFASGYAGSLPLDPRLRARTYFDDPHVRSLIYDVEKEPVPRARIVTALEATPFTIDDLLRVRLLREDAGRYYLGFNYFNARDQASIAEASREVVPSLVQAYLRRRPQLDSLLALYPVATVERSRLAFVLIAGFSLNWDGLKITKERGYRVPIEVEGPGFRYSFWASEELPSLDHHSFYWGSSTLPGGNYNFTPPVDYSFSSFGDPYSDPRMSFPDLLLLQASEMKPAIRDAALRIGLTDDTTFGRRFTSVIGVARGQEIAKILFALREAPADAPRLTASVGGDPGTINAELGLLLEAGYVARDRDGFYHLIVPVLDLQDSAMVNGVLRLSRSIQEEWLNVTFPRLRARLGTLTAMRQGVPFESLFTQIWHELFGLSTRELVQSGLLFDPQNPLIRYKGSLPSLWRQGLYDFSMRP